MTSTPTNAALEDLTADDVRRLMTVFGRSADFTREDDRRIFDAIQARAALTSAGEFVVVPRDVEQLAYMLCEADGRDPHQLTYHTVEPGVQEPYGDMWNHYVPQAEALIKAAAPQPREEGCE